MSRQQLAQLLEPMIAEQATGCTGAGAYRQFAQQQGYKYLEVLDWTSSAGDWQFIVSKNRRVWYVMCQSNNYPRPGFNRTIDTSRPMHGTAQQVLQYIADMYY